MGFKPSPNNGEAATIKISKHIYPQPCLEQRGGVHSFLQNATGHRAPKSTRPMVIALSERAIGRTAGYADENTIFVYDNSYPVPEAEFPKKARKIIGIPAVETANNKLHPRVFNIIIMGAAIGLTKIVSFEAAQEALVHKLGYKFEKDPNLKELNFKALQ